MMEIAATGPSPNSSSFDELALQIFISALGAAPKRGGPATSANHKPRSKLALEWIPWL